jgi:hypothetical protein
MVTFRNGAGVDGAGRTVDDEEMLWQNARTLRAQGELTALWLEAKLARQPGYLGPVDVDDDLAPGLSATLALLNRAGYVTTSSQAGCAPVWPDGERWAQVAAVTGMATAATAEQFSQALAGTRYRVVVSPLRHAGDGDGDFFGTPVTWRAGTETTWFGPVSDLREFPVDAEVALTMVDTVAGPNELWPLLRSAAEATKHAYDVRMASGNLRTEGVEGPLPPLGLSSFGPGLATARSRC